MMDALNYHHLRYFWVVAREGGLVPAGRVLNLSHPTLSAQIRTLEEQLGEKLFTKTGRRLVLTDQGRVAFRYAEEIFGLGREMVQALEGNATGRALRFDVGITDVVPKHVVHRLLSPVLERVGRIHLVCHEGPLDALVADLAQHVIDVVLSDSPPPVGSPTRSHSHVLSNTQVGFFGTPELARRYRRRFPSSLHQAPILLPHGPTTLRRSLDEFFQRHHLEPHVVGEFQDSALLKVFGSDGAGLFPAPVLIEREITAQYGVRLLGIAQGVQERYFAISAERRLKHPAVVAMSEGAQRTTAPHGRRARHGASLRVDR